MGERTGVLLVMWLQSDLPNLHSANYRITSKASPNYNCIAWAAGEESRWWWPDQQNLAYWPIDVPREETLEAFLQVYEIQGFEICENEELEPGYEKIALYALANNVPTHAARQLQNRKWTSKLGPQEDIEHILRDLEGPTYGSVVAILRRPLT